MRPTALTPDRPSGLQTACRLLQELLQVLLQTDRHEAKQMPHETSHEVKPCRRGSPCESAVAMVHKHP